MPICAAGPPRRGEAIRFLEQAVALAPAFALAWASLAEAKLARDGSGLNRSSELADETRVLLDRALGLQPSLPEALIVRADWERQVKADSAAAQRDLDRAETLQPATAGWRFIQALVAKDLGKREEAVRLSRDMVRLNPNNSDCAVVHATQIFWRKGDYGEVDRFLSQGDASRNAVHSNRVDLRVIWRGPAAALRLLVRSSTALKQLRIDLTQAMDRQSEIPALAAEVESDIIEALTERPESPPPYWALKRLVAGGREGAAWRIVLVIRARVTKELEEGNRTPFQRGASIPTEIVLGRRDAAMAALEEWRRENQLVQDSHRRVTKFGDNAAPPYALLGRADEVVAVLREHAAIGLQFTLSLRYDPDFARIRNDPGFQKLKRQQEASARAQPDPVDL